MRSSLYLVQELRQLFLKEKSIESNYWSKNLLEAYDLTLAERIRWKWAHVLNELEQRNIPLEKLFPDSIFQIEDWGCGTGAASSSLAKSFTSQAKDRVEFSFFDRSPEAMSFAQGKVTQLGFAAKNSQDKNSSKIKIRLLSYVLSELAPEAISKILQELKEFDAFIWVDSGSKAMSARLVQCREQLLEDFYFLAPCPHLKSCPLKDSTKDWCHSFANPPQEVFHSSEWATIAKELTIDLRSLPFHYLYAINKKHKLDTTLNVKNRILGRPRILKNFARVDLCDKTGAHSTVEVVKSKNRKLYSQLKKETLFSLDTE